MDHANNLPSEDALEKLTLPALRVYAARNALRASVFLAANQKLKTIWPDDSARHATSLIGVWLWLKFVFDDSSVKDEKDFSAALSATHSAASTASSALSAALSATSAAHSSAVSAASSSAPAALSTVSSAALSATYSALSAARSATSAARSSAVSAASSSAASAAHSATLSAARSSRSAACADYDDLLQKTMHGSTSLWPAIPLWQGFNAKQIQQLQQHFFTELKALGLDFLESDVRYLWDLKGGIAPSRARLDRFVKLLQLFDAEWEETDAAAIKKLLTGDETLSTFNAVRVILIGPGGAGKTALNHLLHHGAPIEQPAPATVAIDYKTIADTSRWQGLLPAEKHEALQTLQLSTWDFAGQTLFYGLHQAFLHENCVYVLVVDSRHEQAPDDWLAQINYLIGNTARANTPGADTNTPSSGIAIDEQRKVRVLIVTNEYENLKARQNQIRLMREYPNLLSQNAKDTFFAFSCLQQPTDSSEYQRFITTLLRECLGSRHIVLRQATQKAIAAVQSEFKRGRINLSFEAMDTLLEKALDAQSPDHDRIEQLQTTLEGLGVVISNGTDSIIDPNKVVSVVYQLLCSAELRKQGGIVDQRQLGQCKRKIQNQQHSDVDLATLSNFLTKRKVCIQENNHYIFPDALPEQEHTTAKAVYENVADANTHRVQVHYDLQFLPFGLNGRLLKTVYAQHPQWAAQQQFWRDGFMLGHEAAQAVLQLNKRKSRIDLTLYGGFEGLIALLRGMHAIVIAEIGASQSVMPFIQLDKQLLTALTPEDLNTMLEIVEDYSDLLRKIKAMAAKNINNITYNNQIGSVESLQQGDGNTQIHITVSAQVKEKLHEILQEYLQNHASEASEKQKSTLQTIAQAAQRGDIDKLPAQEKSIANRIMGSISAIAGTLSSGITIVQFFQKHKDWLVSAIETITPKV